MKTRKFKALLAGALSVCMIASLTACGGSGSSSSSSSDSEDGAAPAAESSEYEGQEAGTTDVVNVGINSNPGSLDVMGGTQSGGNANANVLFYETLGYIVDGEYEGILMDSYELDDDGYTVHITLKDYIHDSIGTAWTAEDCAWDIQVQADADAQNVSTIAAAEATGDYTLDVTFENEISTSDLTSLFVQAQLGICKATYESGEYDYATDPICTGPYVVSKYVQDSCLTLEKNENYWAKDDEDVLYPQMQNVDTLNYWVITEASQMTTALESGTIDIATDISVADVENMFQGNSDYIVKSVEEGLSNVLFANCSENSVMENKNVREAVYYAIDAESVVKSIFGENASVSGVVGSTKCSDYNADWAADWTYDVEKCKELLAAEGYDESNKLPITMIVMPNPTWCSIMEAVQLYLEATGVISCELQELEGGEFFTKMYDPTAWDICHYYAASEDVLPSAWAALRSTFNNGLPIIFTDDAELQELLTTACTESTTSDEATKAAVDYMNENAYAYGLCSNYVNIVCDSWFAECNIHCLNYVLPNANTYYAH